MLLKNNGAGDEDRTRDVELGKLPFDCKEMTLCVQGVEHGNVTQPTAFRKPHSPEDAHR
jgi:hypothetical protein